MKAFLFATILLVCLPSQLPSFVSQGLFNNASQIISQRLLAPALLIGQASSTLASSDQRDREDLSSLRSARLDSLLLGFSVFLILVTLVMALIIPHPTDFQFFIVRVALSIAAGAMGVALPGFISVMIGSSIRATGGAALFLLVYLYNPAKLLKN